MPQYFKFVQWMLTSSLKIVMWCVEGSYFQKAKYCTNDFESCLVIVWAIDDVICEGCKEPVEEHKRIG